MIENYNLFIESVRDMMKPKSKEDLRKGINKLSPGEKLRKGIEFNILSKDEMREAIKDSLEENPFLIFEDRMFGYDVISKLFPEDKIKQISFLYAEKLLPKMTGKKSDSLEKLGEIIYYLYKEKYLFDKADKVGVLWFKHLDRGPYSYGHIDVTGYTKLVNVMDYVKQANRKNSVTESVRDMMKPKSREDIESNLDKLPIFNRLIKMFERQLDSFNNDSKPYYTQEEIDNLVPVFIKELDNVSSDDAIDFLHDYYDISGLLRNELKRRLDLETAGYQIQMVHDLQRLGELYTHNEWALLGKKAEQERKEEARKKLKLTESVRDHMKPRSEEDVRKSLEKIPELKDRLKKGFSFGVYTIEDIKKILKDIPAVDRIRDYSDWKIYSEKDYWDMFENGTPREKHLIGVLLNDRWMKNEVLKDVVPFNKVEIGDYLTIATTISQSKQYLCKVLEKYTFNNKEEFKDYLTKHPGILVASDELKTLFKSFPMVKRNAVVVNIGFNMIMEYGSENVVLPYSEEEIEKNKYLGKFHSEEVKIRMHDDFINESVRGMMKPKTDEDIIKSLSHLTPNERLLKGAGEGIFSLVKNAIEDGADVDTGLQNSGHKWTALFYASLNNYEDIVRYLLSKGASVTSDTLKYTQGRGHNNILKLLKEYQKKQWGLTNESVRDMMKPKSEEDILKGIDNMSYPDVQNLLLKAIRKNELEVVKLIINAGLSVRHNISTLRICLEYNRPEILELLIQKGANIHNQWFEDYIEDYEGTKSYDVIQKYMKTNESVRDMMKPRPEEDIHRLMKDKSPDERLLFYSKMGHLVGVQQALKDGADVHTRDFNTVDSALRNACKIGNLEIVKLLVDLGSDIHLYNDACLKNACQNGHLKVVKYLLDNGAEDYQGNYSWWAGQNGYPEIIKLINQYKNRRTKRINPKRK